MAGQKLVTLFGGSGFIGRHAVRAFANAGYRVRVAVRRPDLAGHLQPMGNVGQIHAVQANVRYPDSVAAAAAGSDAVINLVAVLQSSGKQTFDAVHIDGARIVARAAREAGASRFVQISGLGADPKSRSHYARSKAAGDQAVQEVFPDAVVLRPSVVFGPGDSFFNRFAAMAQISPVLPLIGGGKTRFQPVYGGDVAQAILAAGEGHARPGTIYELGGPEILTFRETLDRVQEYTGRERSYVSLPFWLATIQAVLTYPLPKRPLTVDQVRLLQSDTVVTEAAISEGRTLADLGVTQPQLIEAVVPQYLERFTPKGQYSHYRG